MDCNLVILLGVAPICFAKAKEQKRKEIDLDLLCPSESNNFREGGVKTKSAEKLLIFFRAVIGFSF